MKLCTKWGIHSPNLPRRIAFFHWCTQYGHWYWIRTCASVICGNCCTCEMWDWCGEHVAQHLLCWTALPHWNSLEMKQETCPSARRVWLVQPVGNYVVCKRAMFVQFCDIWLQVVYLTSLLHAQLGWTPLLLAAEKGHVKISQMLMEKGANIEATNEVELMANIYWLTTHGWL